MDVNVRDVEEIVRFGNSVKGFLSDYIGALQMVVNGANQDRTAADNAIRRMRNAVESAKSNLRSAESMVDDAYDRASNYPEEDHSDDIDYATRMVEERQAIYERARQALDEAEGIASRIRNNADRVIEEIYRSRSQIRDRGEEALRSIQHAVATISQYIK